MKATRRRTKYRPKVERTTPVYPEFINALVFEETTKAANRTAEMVASSGGAIDLPLLLCTINALFPIRFLITSTFFYASSRELLGEAADYLRPMYVQCYYYGTITTTHILFLARFIQSMSSQTEFLARLVNERSSSVVAWLVCMGSPLL